MTLMGLAQKIYSECQSFQADFMRFERWPDGHMERIKNAILSLNDELKEAKKQFSDWEWED